MWVIKGIIENLLGKGVRKDIVENIIKRIEIGEMKIKVVAKREGYYGSVKESNKRDIRWKFVWSE